MIIDAHNHLQDSRLDPVREDVFRGMAEAGLRAVVNGTHPGDWSAVSDCCANRTFLYPSFGLHPWWVNDAEEGWERRLRSTLEHMPFAGVGEIGLDRWKEGFDLPRQITAFRIQMDLAAEFQRPVSIHCLRAWGEMLKQLRNLPLPASGFLLHSYGGPVEMIPSFSELGAFFSFSGSILHEGKTRAREAFLQVPPDRLLVETDAPDMVGPTEVCPWPMEAGGRPCNHPLNLAAITASLAQLRGMPLEEFHALLARNFLRWYPAAPPVPGTS